VNHAYYEMKLDAKPKLPDYSALIYERGHRVKSRESRAGRPGHSLR